MTAVITATPDTVNAPPRVTLSVSGFTGPTTVSVTRVDAAGNSTPVRSASPAALVAGAWVGWDYEAPHGKPVTYMADAAVGTVTTHAQAATTLPATQPWLIHPGIPAMSQPLLAAAISDFTREANQGVHRPLGRRTAIVITDGQRRAETFDLTVRTSAEAQENALLDLLDDSSVLLLQIAYSGTAVARASYWWVSVGTLVASRLVPTLVAGPGDLMHWTLPCTVASRPSGLLQSQRTWADVVAQNATWADVVSKYATWRDLILDNQAASNSATSGEIFVDNLDGTVTETGATDNGDGSLAIVSGIDNSNGTVTVG